MSLMAVLSMFVSYCCCDCDCLFNGLDSIDTGVSVLSWPNELVYRLSSCSFSRLRKLAFLLIKRSECSLRKLLMYICFK